PPRESPPFPCTTLFRSLEQPALDAWSTAAALAAVTSKIELMVAVRPNFHQPALFAKAAANIDNISGGRLALNVVSSWWADEATRSEEHTSELQSPYDLV